jgi:nicotinate-nucleotide adenylyltransferase
MTQRAIAGNAAFCLDDAEALSEEPSYSVTTLHRLRDVHGPRRPLVLLMGADAFLGLATWHRWRELFGLAHIAVASRPGYPLQARQMTETLAAEFGARSHTSNQALTMAAAGAIFQFEITPLAISASQIRALLGAARSARYLLPDPVLDYIGLNRLYSPDPHGH